MLSAVVVLIILFAVCMVLQAREDVKTRLERHDMRRAAEHWDESEEQ